MLTKEISEVEKGCGKSYQSGKAKLDNRPLISQCNRESLCPICQKEKETLKSAQQRFNQLKELFNPDKAFPLDIFPDISKKDIEQMNILLENIFGFPLDRLSAFIGRKHYKNFIDELSSKQEGKE